MSTVNNTSTCLHCGNLLVILNYNIAPMGATCISKVAFSQLLGVTIPNHHPYKQLGSQGGSFLASKMTKKPMRKSIFRINDIYFRANHTYISAFLRSMNIILEEI